MLVYTGSKQVGLRGPSQHLVRSLTCEKHRCPLWHHIGDSFQKFPGNLVSRRSKRMKFSHYRGSLQTDNRMEPLMSGKQDVWVMWPKRRKSHPQRRRKRHWSRPARRPCDQVKVLLNPVFTSKQQQQSLRSRMWTMIRNWLTCKHRRLHDDGRCSFFPFPQFGPEARVAAAWGSRHASNLVFVYQDKYIYVYIHSYTCIFLSLCKQQVVHLTCFVQVQCDMWRCSSLKSESQSQVKRFSTGFFRDTFTSSGCSRGASRCLSISSSSQQSYILYSES